MRYPASLSRTLLPLLLVTTTQAWAQAPEFLVDTATPKQVRAVRVNTPPVIDGRLDDPIWQQAELITDFHQTRPGNGTAPSERTEVYVLYDDDALYIAARMYDSDPDQIAAPVIRHGQGMPSDDRLVVILDPFNSRRAGYRFETNLNAARHDSLYTSVNSFSIDWNTIWDVAASVEGNAWVAEIEIPFKSIPFDPAIETWGFNFGRAIRRRGEEIAWVSQNRTYNPSISGQMTGLTGLSAGAGLDIVPSMSSTRSKVYGPAGNSEVVWQPSLDAFYRLTPSLNAAVTINTDFSATEVDNRQVNLSRFNLFFPEKRDFFLNDSDLFQFGNISGMAAGNNSTSGGSRENARPFFSRKIGLSQTGAPVDINYGGRISGRVGRWNIGTLAIRQDEAVAVDASDLFVTRVSANILNDSSVGFIYTDGDPTSNRDNSVYGADFRYLNNSIGNGRSFEADAWFQRSDTPGLNGDDASFGFGLRLPNNTGWRSRLAFKEVQRNFNPAMGYVNRTNVRDYTADLGYTHFFTTGKFQSVFAGVDAQRIDVIDGQLQSEILTYRLMELQSTTRDSLRVAYTTNKEVVQRPFTLYSSQDRVVSIQPGQYSFNESRFDFSTGGQRTLVGSFSYQTGDFYNGKRDNIGISATWNQSRNFVLRASYDWNDIELPQGDFITRLLSVNSQVAFSTTLYWISLVQYDNLSEEIGINTRLQWIPRAGQEGFIVLNYNMQDKDKDNRFQMATSDISVKLKYTLRF